MSPLSDYGSISKEYSDFKLHIGKPIVIAHGATQEELGWGPYQFPNVYRTAKGSLICRWSNHNDRLYGGKQFDIPSCAVSDDGGLTWRAKTDGDVLSHVTRSRMANGRYFAGFRGKESYVLDCIGNYTPLRVTYQNKRLFFADDIKEIDRSFYASEYDPVTQQINTFPCEIHWPDEVVSIYPGDILHPPQREFALANGLGDFAIGDKLYYCMYARGVNPKTRKIEKYSEYFSSFVFCSEDSARTWNLLSQVYTTDAVYEEMPRHTGPVDGLSEPMMSLMPDGSVVMLMRTGGNQPSYLVRSTDGCRTWSDPVKFDEVGVRPFILTLPCGVSLSSYGRDGLFFRATRDPSGLAWQEHIEIPLGDLGKVKSCYYTYLLPLDDTHVLFVYSDFYYSPTGKECDIGKSVIGRIVTVEPK